jgi:hypothetical protein
MASIPDDTFLQLVFTEEKTRITVPVELQFTYFVVVFRDCFNTVNSPSFTLHIVAMRRSIFTI